MKKIVITGSSGFIGANLVESLKKDNYIIQDYSKPLTQIKEEVDIVFHQAAITGNYVSNKKDIFESNYYYSINLFQSLLKLNCQNFIYASTTAVYGNAKAPQLETTKCDLHESNWYGNSKMLFEKWATEFGKDNKVNVLGLRYCNVYGNDESHKGKLASMIFQIIQQIKNKQNPKIFEFGEQKRDWIYVKDVVNANIKAMNFQGVDVINCGYGKSHTFNELVKIINSELNTNFEPEYIKNNFEHYQNHTECDMKKARNLLNFEPQYDLISGIRDYLKIISS